MSTIIHERPGVYSSYDASTVIRSGVGSKVVGIAAQADTGEADAVITTGQAADILGVSRRTVTRMLDRGELPGTRLGLNHHRSVRLADVLAFKDRGVASRES